MLERKVVDTECLAHQQGSDKTQNSGVTVTRHKFEVFPDNGMTPV